MWRLRWGFMEWIEDQINSNLNRNLNVSSLCYSTVLE